MKLPLSSKSPKDEWSKVGICPVILLQIFAHFYVCGHDCLLKSYLSHELREKID